jgi:hypothetical protein
MCVRARVDDWDSFLAIFMAFALYLHVFSQLALICKFLREISSFCSFFNAKAKGYLYGRIVCVVHAYVILHVSVVCVAPLCVWACVREDVRGTQLHDVQWYCCKKFKVHCGETALRFIVCSPVG